MFKLIVSGPEGPQVKAFRSFEHAVRWAKQQAEAGQFSAGLLQKDEQPAMSTVDIVKDRQVDDAAD